MPLVRALAGGRVAKSGEAPYAVWLLVKDGQGRPLATGSGYFAFNDHTLMTNAHVLRKAGAATLSISRSNWTGTFDPDAIEVAMGPDTVKYSPVFDTLMSTIAMSKFPEPNYVRAQNMLVGYDVAAVDLPPGSADPNKGEVLSIRPTPLAAGEIVTIVGFGPAEAGVPTPASKFGTKRVGFTQVQSITDAMFGAVTTAPGSDGDAADAVAKVLHGDSGGPVVDANGYLVAMNQAMSLQDNRNFLVNMTNVDERYLLTSQGLDLSAVYETAPIAAQGLDAPSDVTADSPDATGAESADHDAASSDRGDGVDANAKAGKR